MERYRDSEEEETKKKGARDEDDDPDEDEGDGDADNNGGESDDDEDNVEKALQPVGIVRIDDLVEAQRDMMVEEIQKALAPFAEVLESLSKAITDMPDPSAALTKALKPIVSHIDDCFEATESNMTTLQKAISTATLEKAVGDDLEARTTPAVRKPVASTEQVLEKAVSTPATTVADTPLDEAGKQKLGTLVKKAESLNKAISEVAAVYDATSHNVALTTGHLTNLEKALGL